MKKIFAVFISQLLISLIVCSFASCSRIDNNAKILQEGVKCREEWLENNYTRGSYQSDFNNDLPESRTHLIQTQAELDEIFSDFPKINFDKEMVLVYCYTTVYIRDQKLEQATIDNGVLTVKFNVVRGKLGYADAASPHTRICVIRLRKIGITEANITYVGQ